MTVLTSGAVHKRDLVRELVTRDVRLRYRGKTLGPLWAQLSPIASAIVFTILFTRVIRLDIPNYPVFVFIGVEVWRWFSSALTAGASSVASGSDLLRQPNFPTSLLPFIAVTTQATYFLLALPVIFAAVLITTGGIPLTVAWLPLVMLVQLGICVGCAYVLAVLHVAVRDTSDVLSVVLRLMFFVTPLIYDGNRLEGTGFEALFVLNPMAHLVTAYRDVMLYGRAPDLAALFAVAVLAVLLLGAGWTLYERRAPRFVDAL